MTRTPTQFSSNLPLSLKKNNTFDSICTNLVPNHNYHLWFSAPQESDEVKKNKEDNENIVDFMLNKETQQD